MQATEERRKRKRVALHWPVRLFRGSSTLAVECTTENLTIDGFYCFSKEPFLQLERLECIISIPAGRFGYSESPLVLQCRVCVTRVEHQKGSFGLGCLIEHYDLLVSRPSEPSVAAQFA